MHAGGPSVDVEEADHLCDSVALMTLGRLVALGAPADLKLALGPESTLDDVLIHYTGGGEERGTFQDAARTRRTAHRLE